MNGHLLQLYVLCSLSGIVLLKLNSRLFALIPTYPAHPLLSVSGYTDMPSSKIWSYIVRQRELDKVLQHQDLRFLSRDLILSGHSQQNTHNKLW